MPPVRVGLVGYGIAGSVFHAPLLQAVPELQLAAIATSRRAQVEKELPGVAVVASADELINDPKLDLLVVASPSHTHFDITKAALLAGKPVVVDKPFAASSQQADELLALAEQQELFLSVFQNRRWDGGFLTAKRCIADGSLGTVYHYEAHFDRYRPQIKAGWREEPHPASGVLYDLGAHLIDQALHLFGMPDSVWADVLTQRPVGCMDDYFHLVLAYGRMRAILHAGTLVRAPGPHLAVHGDAGSYAKFGLDGQEAALREGKRPGDSGWGQDEPALYGELTNAEGQSQRVPTMPGAYEQYYRGVAASLLQGAPPPVDPSGSYNGLLVLEAALRSAAERRAVALE